MHDFSQIHCKHRSTAATMIDLDGNSCKKPLETFVNNLATEVSFRPEKIFNEAERVNRARPLAPTALVAALDSSQRIEAVTHLQALDAAFDQ